jgi:uncharacterized protein YacL
MTLLALGGWWFGDWALSRGLVPGVPQVQWVLVLVGAVLGFVLTPWLTVRPLVWARRGMRQIPTQSLLGGTIGLAIGLFLAVLLAVPLSFLPSPWGWLLPILAAIVFGYLGMTAATTRQKEFSGGILSRFFKDVAGAERDNYVLLDTSVIIDGRIADISQTGFIERTMLIPRFILNELQHIADSPDTLRRNRGRRGLDMLNKLQKESVVPIQITDTEVKDAREVDDKLVKLARQLNCPIITNDYNLNRVAELQGIKVLNINKLANAVKSVVLPGETIKVRIIQEGKELGQGVGYLDDGTMVVVENGRRYINSTLEVTVTRVLQTVAGRMIFATPNGSSLR